MRIGRAPILQNCAPVRSILKIADFAYPKIPLPRESVEFLSVFHFITFKNRALARGILKISPFFLQRTLQKLCSRAEHLPNSVDFFVQNSVPAQSILKILNTTALPCGACRKFPRKLRSRAEHPQNWGVLEILTQKAFPCGAF